MRGLLFRWVVNAGGLLLVSYLFEGIQVASVGWAFIAALFLGIINALIRPVVLVLTLPINVLTLGLFTIVVNALMLWLTGSLLAGFWVSGFWSAVGGALVLSLISFAVNSLVNDQGRWEVIEMRRSRGGQWRER
ncbi:MAG: phage holin family protein [Pseudomonadota bacterium]